MTRRMLALALTLATSPALAQGEGNVLSLETTWRTEAGTSTSLAAWKGKWFVLSFVYTSCTSTCPLTTKKLKRLDAELIKRARNVDFVVISLDPDKDTPEAVARYRKRYQLEELARWNVLVGAPAQVRTLTMLLNFRYSQNPESGAILHDNTVFLVGPDGEVKASMSSLDQSLEAFLSALPVK